MTSFAPSFGMPAPTLNTNIPNSLDLVLDLDPAKFDALTKILNLLQDNDVVSIKDSQIVQSIKGGTTFFTSNIESIIGPNVNLDFTNPKRIIKIFKLIKSASNIKIFNDPDMERYKLVSDEAIFYLSKPNKVVEDALAAIPNRDDLTFLGLPVVLAGDSKSRAKNYVNSSEESHVDLLIEENQLKAVFIPADMIYHFSEFKNPNIDPENAELSLRSFTFLSIDGEKTDIFLATHNNKYLIITRVNTVFNGVVFDIYEYVDAVSTTNLLI